MNILLEDLEAGFFAALDGEPRSRHYETVVEDTRYEAYCVGYRMGEAVRKLVNPPTKAAD